MSKVIINIADDGCMSVTYDNGKLIYPICDIEPDKFTISEITHNEIITLISNLLHQVGTVLRNQLVKQGFTNKPLNKPTDRK